MLTRMACACARGRSESHAEGSAVGRRAMVARGRGSSARPRPVELCVSACACCWRGPARPGLRPWWHPRSRRQLPDAVDRDQPAAQRRSGAASANGWATTASSTAWIYTNDVLANVRGGDRTRARSTRASFEGILHGRLRASSPAGRALRLFANAFQIHNTGRIRRDYVGGINTIAAIEAVPTTRLSELWLEQKFVGGAASLRVGQLAADVEFFFSDLSAMFLQSDWPTIAAVNLPSGGRGLSAVDARRAPEGRSDQGRVAAARGAQRRSGRAGTGRRADPQSLRPQLPRPRSGLHHRRGAVPAQSRQGRQPALPRTLEARRLGAISAQFDDQRFANDGIAARRSGGSGVPAQRRGNSGVYAVIDQQLWRPRGGGPDSGISVFSRVSAEPF